MPEQCEENRRTQVAESMELLEATIREASDLTNDLHERLGCVLLPVNNSPLPDQVGEEKVPFAEDLLRLESLTKNVVSTLNSILERLEL